MVIFHSYVSLPEGTLICHVAFKPSGSDFFSLEAPKRLEATKNQQGEWLPSFRKIGMAKMLAPKPRMGSFVSCLSGKTYDLTKKEKHGNPPLIKVDGIKPTGISLSQAGLPGSDSNGHVPVSLMNMYSMHPFLDGYSIQWFSHDPIASG